MTIISSVGDHNDLRTSGAEALALEQLPDGELAELARSLRVEALRGNRKARGQAHMCEVELRRRHSATEARSREPLDLRSLEQRQRPQAWWKLW
ncbi:hypothetical protein GCM10007320_29600 [Pseudorhodoferax aquiterrae]|uniref:Uncharacterized protein n=2 Tax=Pseudorhodoferax aquiterrae TaxID=747304 RepID=A0ABQ3G2A9_9BURK|nr:hypothetical protein GCM10007320_29600 [Pseudorhodoferax aquiterrae]